MKAKQIYSTFSWADKTTEPDFKEMSPKVSIVNIAFQVWVVWNECVKGN